MGVSSLEPDVKRACPVASSATRPPRAARLHALPLVVAAVLAGCGDSSTDPTAGGGIFTAPLEGTPMVDIFYGAYLDHDASEGARDYACGIKAYDGHRGVDILLRNFLVQDSGVTVIAAASGRVESVVDGLPDRNTSWDGGGFGNHVVVLHADQSRSIYGHLRQGSIMVTAGRDVPRGEPLGLVGSSGQSNWPHLHFEVRRGGAAVDPFSGECGPQRSLWSSQLSYQDQFMVTDAGVTEDQELTLAVLLERPPTLDSIPLDTERIRFWLQVANQRANAVRYEIRAPNGDVANQVTFQAGPTFSMRYLLLSVQVAGVLTSPGDWEILTFQEDELVWTHPFTLVPAAEGVDAPAAAIHRVRPAIEFEVLDQVPHGHRHDLPMR